VFVYPIYPSKDSTEMILLKVLDLITLSDIQRKKSSRWFYHTRSNCTQISGHGFDFQNQNRSNHQIVSD